MRYRIEIVEKHTGEVVETINAINLAIAVCIKDGVDRNLSYEEYSTRIVEIKES